MELTTRHPLERPIMRMFVAHSGGGSKKTIEQLGLSPDIVNLLREKWGIKELYPPQQIALPHALNGKNCLLYTSPSPRDQRGSRMPSSA